MLLSRKSVALAAMRCAVSSRSWNSERSALITPGSHLEAPTSAEAVASPPVKATEATPVKPVYSSRALVSVRTGTCESMSIKAGDARRILRHELDGGHLADAHSVEKNRIAPREARHRAGEDDLIDRMSGGLAPPENQNTNKKADAITPA